MRKKVVIKYYSVKLLLTVDLNSLVHGLHTDLGNGFEIDFSQMTESEKHDAIEDVSGIAKIKYRLIVLVDSERRRDLEKLVRSI